MDIELYTYIFASLAKYFNTVFNLCGKLYLQGMVLPSQENLINLSIPQFITSEKTKGQYETSIEVNILVQTAFAGNILSENLYKHQSNLGLISKSFLSSLPMYKYGVDGDGSFLGCIQRIDNAQDQGVVVTDFGQLTTVKVFQATVESQYVYSN